MREKINRLAKGNIEGSSPQIRIEPAALELTLKKGEKRLLEFTLSAEEDNTLKGLAYSRDPRVRILTPAFGGKSAAVTVEFDLSAALDGEECSGCISLVTNGGELELPYTVRVQSESPDDFLKNLTSVEEYVRIAEADRDVALRLFVYKNFKNAPFLQDPRTRALYQAFSGRPDRELAMDQFILSCGGHPAGGSESAPEQPAERSGEAAGDEAAGFIRDYRQDRYIFYKRHLVAYHRARIDYEISGQKDGEALRRMSEELDKLTPYRNEHIIIVLLRAECEFLLGNPDRARGLMDTVRNTIINNRQAFLDEYFLLEYLNCRIAQQPDKTAALVRLLNKFIREEHKPELFYFSVQLDPDLPESSRYYYDFMHALYQDGLNSPYLYIYYIRFLNEHPEYLHEPTDLDMHALNFGSRHRMLSAELVRVLTERAASLNFSSPLYYPIFRALYTEKKDKALIQAICSALIRSNRREARFHSWYAAGIAENASITGLYEYYMYSLPEKDLRIDRDVLMHFAYQNSLDAGTRARLYAYILQNGEARALAFKVYEAQITEFALSQLKERRVSRDLAVLYRYLISSGKDLSGYYEYLTEVLFTYSYEAPDPETTALVAVYPEIRHEQSYPVENGSACITVLSERQTVLKQDAFGNRYVIEGIRREKLLDEPAALEECRRNCPDDLILQLDQVNRILEAEETKAEDAADLELAMRTLPLSDLYSARIFEKLLHYYESHAAGKGSRSFLLDVDRSTLNRRERSRLINALICSEAWKEAYEAVCAEGMEGVEPERLRDLCTALIRNDEFRKDAVSDVLCGETLRRDCYNGTILDHLCEHYNSSTADMYDLFRKARENDIPMYDLDERLLAQMIFVNNNGQIDDVFRWYADHRKASESIVKAYFTMKTERYFAEDEDIDGTIFEYIESVAEGMNSPDELPVIHQLALTKYYASLESLDEKRKKLAEGFVNSLINRGYVLPHFKTLGKMIPIPASVRDTALILYRSTSAAPYIMLQIEPSEKIRHRGILNRMYGNLYVCENTLFQDEVLHYEIYEPEGGMDVLKEQGTLRYEDPGDQGDDSRFGLLNDMLEEYQVGNDSGLQYKMEDYLRDTLVAAELFRSPKSKK